jgi:hypothetical protein
VEKCDPINEEHDGYHDTGDRTTAGDNPPELAGEELQVWRCQCGAKTMEVYTKLINLNIDIVTYLREVRDGSRQR